MLSPHTNNVISLFIQSLCLFLYIGTAMVLHYTRFIECLTNCPIPIAFGKSGTGKTNALRCGLSVLGAHEFRFYHH